MQTATTTIHIIVFDARVFFLRGVRGRVCLRVGKRKKPSFRLLSVWTFQELLTAPSIATVLKAEGNTAPTPSGGKG